MNRERPGGRLLLVEGPGHTGQPIMLTEFGGIALSKDADETWGYSRVETPEAFAEKYRELLTAVRSVSLLAGFCYTQFADTYQETNGLLYADRTPKFSLEEIERATRGARSDRDRQLERQWRERIMEAQRGQYHVPPEDYRIQQERY